MWGWDEVKRATRAAGHAIRNITVTAVNGIRKFYRVTDPVLAPLGNAVRRAGLLVTLEVASGFAVRDCNAINHPENQDNVFSDGEVEKAILAVGYLTVSFLFLELAIQNLRPLNRLCEKIASGSQSSVTGRIHRYLQSSLTDDREFEFFVYKRFSQVVDGLINNLTAAASLASFNKNESHCDGLIAAIVLLSTMMGSAGVATFRLEALPEALLTDKNLEYLSGSLENLSDTPLRRAKRYFGNLVGTSAAAALGRISYNIFLTSVVGTFRDPKLGEILPIMVLFGLAEVFHIQNGKKMIRFTEGYQRILDFFKNWSMGIKGAFVFGSFALTLHYGRRTEPFNDQPAPVWFNALLNVIAITLAGSVVNRRVFPHRVEKIKGWGNVTGDAGVDLESRTGRARHISDDGLPPKFGISILERSVSEFPGRLICMGNGRSPTVGSVPVIELDGLSTTAGTGSSGTDHHSDESSNPPSPL